MQRSTMYHAERVKRLYAPASGTPGYAFMPFRALSLPFFCKGHIDQV